MRSTRPQGPRPHGSLHEERDALRSEVSRLEKELQKALSDLAKAKRYAEDDPPVESPRKFYTEGWRELGYFDWLTTSF